MPDPKGFQTDAPQMEYWYTRQRMEDVLSEVIYRPHAVYHEGEFKLTDDVFATPGRECNTIIHPTVRIDCTANVTIGPWCMIAGETRILTHDHFHGGRDKPLIQVMEEKGVFWSDITIGRDVWLHGCLVLAQVTEIPDGVVVGADAVLTKNPGPYEIWAGCPARKVGER